VPDRSRSALGRLIRDGAATVDGRQGRPGQALKAGQRVELVLPAPAPVELVPEDIPFGLPYEDEHVAVVDKPAGLVVHPAAGHATGTLVHALLHRLEGLAGVGDRLRPGIVHRLDKDTSGLMVVAKTDAAHARLAADLAARRVRREYRAIVWGRLDAPEGEVDAPIGRDPRHRKRMAVLEAGGRPAVTRYSRMDTLPGFDYIRLDLQTGRTHQIRVHLAHLGHPLLGDPLYGGRRGRLRGGSRPEIERCRELLALIDRQALHAFRLGFAHPATGEEMQFESPLPPDMTAVLDRLRSEARTQGDAE
jgi:23S rRNA pseudouridine1911/1915/1917 synthase